MVPYMLVFIFTTPFLPKTKDPLIEQPSIIIASLPIYINPSLAFKLEHKNVILQYTARLNPSAVEQNLLAFIFIKANNGIGCNATAASLASIPEVQEVHHAAGDDSYLIKIRTRNSASLMDLMRNTIGKIPNIQTTRTTIILETVKEQQQLVIPRK